MPSGCLSRATPDGSKTPRPVHHKNFRAQHAPCSLHARTIRGFPAYPLREYRHTPSSNRRDRPAFIKSQVSVLPTLLSLAKTVGVKCRKLSTDISFRMHPTTVRPAGRLKMITTSSIHRRPSGVKGHQSAAGISAHDVVLLATPRRRSGKL